CASSGANPLPVPVRSPLALPPRFALGCAVLVLLAAPAAAQVAALRPVDEAVDDPSFVTFRARLMASLAARDTAAVLAAFAPDARLSFGDDAPGPEGVRRLWLGRRRAGEPTLWETLARVAAMGSVRDPNSPAFVSAPYLYN